MKTWKVYLTLVVLSFMVGLGLVAAYPAIAAAGDAPPEPTCEHSCDTLICGGPGTCPYGYVPYNICGRSPFCGAPNSTLCECTQVGCGFPC